MRHSHLISFSIRIGSEIALRLFFAATLGGFKWFSENSFLRFKRSMTGSASTACYDLFSAGKITRFK
jgi:hypothetical protein